MKRSRLINFGFLTIFLIFIALIIVLLWFSISTNIFFALCIFAISFYILENVIVSEYSLIWAIVIGIVSFIVFWLCGVGQIVSHFIQDHRLIVIIIGILVGLGVWQLEVSISYSYEDTKREKERKKEEQERKEKEEQERKEKEEENQKKLFFDSNFLRVSFAKPRLNERILLQFTNDKGDTRKYYLNGTSESRKVDLFESIKLTVPGKITHCLREAGEFGFLYSEDMIDSWVDNLLRLYDGQYDVLYKDQGASQNEEKRQRKQKQNNQYKQDSNSNLIAHYLDVLELNHNAPISLEDIKKAYRKMSKLYHPDTIEGKNLSQGFIDYANKMMIEIREAYDYLIEHFNEL